MRGLRQGRRGALAALALVALLVVAPLAALAAEASEGSAGVRFTFSSGEDGPPTLLVGPDRVPYAVWMDSDGRTMFSRLTLMGTPKAGVPLSNLPAWTTPAVSGWVDTVAMDAHGTLHVVWDDGDGTVWHKAYDTSGNVVVGDHALSGSDVTATSPSVATTAELEGAAAWVAWVEELPGFGTHVRLVSLDAASRVLASGLVDGYASPFDPLAASVQLDADGEPNLAIATLEGAVWAVPDPEGGFELVSVHGSPGGSIPVLADLRAEGRWIVWLQEGALLSRPLEGSSLGVAEVLLPASSSPGIPRAVDSSTLAHGGPGVVLTAGGAVVGLVGDGSGGVAVETLNLHEDAEPAGAASVAVDDRGQTYLAWSDRRGGAADGYFAVTQRAPDAVLVAPALSVEGVPTMLRPGSALDVGASLRSQVGYGSRAVLSVERLAGPSHFTVALPYGSSYALEPFADESLALRLEAEEGAQPGTSATFRVTAAPEGWPGAASALEFAVQVPERRPFMVRAPEEPLVALPGETVATAFSVESWSDSDLQLELKLEAPTGWHASVDGPVELPAGDTVEVVIEVTAPPATPAGTLVAIEVTGRTSAGEAGNGASLPTVVAPHHGAVLELEEGVMVVRPGGSEGAEARVRNSGNQPMVVSLATQPTRFGWSARAEPAELELTPGSEATAVVWITAPADAPHGQGCDVRVIASLGGTVALDSATLGASAGRVIDLEAHLYPVSAPVTDGIARLTLEMVNGGNAVEDLEVELVGLPEDWECTLAGAGRSVSLSPGETRTLDVLFTVPDNAPPEEVHVAAVLRGARGQLTRWATLHVLQAFGAELELGTDTVTLTPPGTVELPLSVLNTGNVPDTVVLSASGVPPNWDYTFHTPDGEPGVSFPVAVGEAAEASFALKVPADATGDDHAITLTLGKPGGQVLAERTLFVRLRFPDLAVSDVGLDPSSPEEGEAVRVSARVHNLGSASAVDVMVVLKRDGRVLDRDMVHLIPVGGDAEVVLYFLAPQGRTTLVVEADPSDAIRELSEYNNLAKRRIEVAGAADEPLVPPEAARLAGAAVLTLSILGLLTGTEAGKWALFGLFLVPLYTKLRKDKVLDHYLRGKIHGYIIANPGEHYNAIKEQLEVTNGALSYHLRVLEREGYVRSRMDGMYKRFYPADMKLPRTHRNISSFQEVILTIVKNNQGLSQKDIAKRIGASSQVINYHVKILEEADLIKVDRSRRRSRVYATDTPDATAASPTE